MKKAKISTNDLKALYTGGIVICVAIFYFLGWQVFHMDAEWIQEENTRLETKVSDLEQKEANRSNIEKETKKYEADTEKVVEIFPEKVTTEKMIGDIVDMEKETGKSRVTDAAFTMNTLFYPQTGASDTSADSSSDTTENASTDNQTSGYSQGVITVYRSQSALSFEKLSYDGLKKLIDYANNYKGRMTIEEMAMQFDSATGKLGGSVTLNYYSLVGSPTKYEPPKTDGVKLGRKNIFGTFEKRKSSKSK